MRSLRGRTTGFVVLLGAVCATLIVAVGSFADNGPAPQPKATTVSAAAAQLPALPPGAGTHPPAVRAALPPARSEQPAAKAQRARTRTAYAHLGAADAVDVLTRELPEVMGRKAWDGPDLPSGAHVTGYDDGDHTAVVADGSASVAYASTLPLRAKDATGKPAPVDLGLEPTTDGLRAVNPLIAVTLPDDLRDGLLVGDVGVKVGGLATSVADAEQTGDTATWANALTDTDIVANAVPAGAEITATLRSADSPEDVPVSFQTPAGVTVRPAAFDTELTGGLVMVDADQHVVGTATAPVAWDADGTPVATEWRRSGDDFVLHTTHHGLDLAYPIVVDPTIGTDDRAGGALAAGMYGHPWSYEDDTGLIGHYEGDGGGGVAGFGTGLYARLLHETHYFSGAAGAYWWVSLADRPTARILQMHAQDMSHDSGVKASGAAAGTCAFLRILKSDFSPDVNGPQQANCATFRGWLANVGNVSNTTASGGSYANQAQIGIIPSSADDRYYFMFYVGELALGMQDDTAPATPTIDGPGPNWINAASVPITVHATDTGLGVKSIGLSTDGGGVAWADANPTYPTCVICPKTLTPVASVSPADGAHTVTGSVRDPVAHVSAASGSTPVNIDRTAPVPTTPAASALTLSAEANGTTRYAGGIYTATAKATDATSGIKSMTMTIDNASPVTQTTGCAQPTACPGAKTRVFSFQAPSGTHEVEVTATDLADNVMPALKSTFTTSAAVPVLDSHVGLEKYWDYDTVDTGAGSQLLANAEDGNVLWHDVPVVDPGRGLSTYVSLTYNSQDAPRHLGQSGALDPVAWAAAPFSDPAAGPGMSLSISGPTRLNEPLAGVVQADMRGDDGTATTSLPGAYGNTIVLTDADGTRHTFTRNTTDGRRWNQPAGARLTLRHMVAGDDAWITRRWVMTRPDGVAYFYNKLGFLVSTADRNGNTLTYNYDPYDLLMGVGGTAASSCSFNSMIGSPVAGSTPSAANSWGLGSVLDQSVTAGSSLTGKLCLARVKSVTDAGGRSLTVTYKTRPAADQSAIDAAIAANRPSGAATKTLRALTGAVMSAVASSTAYGIGISAPPVATITDHAGRQTTFDYDLASGSLNSLVEVANAGTLAPAGDKARRWAFAYGVSVAPGLPPRLTTVTEDRDSADGGPQASTVRYTTRTGSSPSLLVPDRFTDRRGNITHYSFSPDAVRPRTFTVTDARAKSWVHEVDGFGRPAHVTDPLGNANDLTWDGANTTESHDELTRSVEGHTTTDPGAVTKMTYEPNTGALASQTTYPDGESTPSTARVTTLSYQLSRGSPDLRPATDPATDYVADLTRVARPRTVSGANVGYKYVVDANTGNVTSRSDIGDQGTASTVYCNGTDCPKGLVKQETDEVGNITTYADFDATGMPQTVVDPKGNASPGVTSPNAAAHRWLYRYDSVGNLLSASDPRNADALANPAAATPATRFTTAFNYDAFDRVIQQVTPKDSAHDKYITRTWAYDRNGNVVDEANPGTGGHTTATFSATDQPLTVTQTGYTRTTSDPRSNTYTTRPEVTTFSYDVNDLLISRTDPRGASGVPAGGGSPSLPYTTEWTRDPAGRVVAESRHATSTVHVQSFALDPRGNIVGQNDAARNADPDGNPTTNDALTPQAAADAAAAAVATSQLGKLRVSMAYDRVDELLAQTERPAPTDATGSPRTSKYIYDLDGNVVKQILPRDDHDVPAGFTSGAGNVAKTYTYDHRDQLVTTIDPTGAATAVKRRADGKPIAQTTPRGVANGATEGDGSYKYFTTHYTYDPAGDLLTRSVPFSPNQYSRTGDANNDYKSWKVSYTRDAVGNPATIVDGRNKTITNTFLDSGQLASTSRPSWWSLTWGAANGAPDPGRRYTDPATADQLPVGGPQLAERPAPLTGVDTSSDQSQSTAQGKFGAVTPADAPSWLPRGGATLLGYDDDGRLTSVTDAALSVSRIDYDPTGRIVGTTQPLGASAGATLAAGDPTPCTRTTAGCEGVIAHRYDYDLDGNTTKSSLLGDTSWHSDLTYDSFDRAVNRTDPGASGVPSSWTSFSDTREETQYGYDANDNLTERVTPRGAATTTVDGDFEYHYDYDTLDRLIGETNPEGDRWGYAWDVDDELLRELTPNGSAAAPANQDTYKTLRTYDAADRLLTEQGPIVGGARNTSTYTYFQDGTMASRTDPGGVSTDGGSDVARLTSYDYDGRGLRNRATQGHAASGGFSTAGTGPRTTLTEYDANSNLRRVVDPSGVTMSGTGASQSWAPTNPDVIGDNLTSTTSTDAVHATVYDYTDRTNSYSAGESGEPTAIYQPRSSTSDTVYAEKVDYDPLDRTRTIWTVDNVNAGSPFSVHSSYDRLRNGWISGSQDFATATVQINNNTYNYDQAGSQLSWKLDPDVTTTANKISSIGREYWPNGEMKTRTGSALVGTTTVGTPRSYSYWYDPNESLVGVHDAAHSRMTYIDRDDAGRASSVVQRYGTGSSDENAGTLAWQRGRDSAFTYDHDGNVTLRRVNGTLNRSDGTMADPSSGSPQSHTRFTYDPEDKETIGAFYEPSKLTGSPTIDDSTCAAGGSPPAGVRCVRTTYHPSDQRRTRRQQDDTLVTTYFDDFGQPTERRRRPTGASDIVTSYTYDIRGNRLTDSPGVGTYTYNARNQLASWKRGTDFNANGVDHHDWTIDYTRNPDGSVEHTTEKQAGGSLVRTKSSSYTGQRLDNVKTTLPSGGTPTWEVYGYNEFRSTVGVQTGVSSTTAPTFTVPSAVKSEDCSTALPATASDTTLYCHDEFDRLTRQRSPGAGEQQQFEYDGMDRRDNRTDHVGGTTDKSGYKYIGATSSISGQQVATGATTSSAMSYDRDSANAPLAVTLQVTGSSTQTTKTFATDANGNPTGLEESNGTVPGANRYVYDPYGDLDIDANAGMAGDAATNPLRFNGFDYDTAVKTYDMQARDYRPSVGRFLQSDRYESAQSDLSLVADPLTQNRYDFAGADPVGSVEFDGHSERPITNGPNEPYGNVEQPARSKKIQDDRASQEDRSTKEHFRANPDERPAGVPAPKPLEVATARPKKSANPFIKLGKFINENTVNLQKNPNCSSLTASCNLLQFGNGGTADAAASFSLFVPGGGGLRFGAKSAVLPAAKRLFSRKGAAKAGTDLVRYDADAALGRLAGGNPAKASELADFAGSQGWARSQTATGPMKFTDENGVTRLTIKSGSARTPGSNFAHVEIRNAAGQRVDPYGNLVPRKSPGNHTPIIGDLP